MHYWNCWKYSDIWCWIYPQILITVLHCGDVVVKIWKDHLILLLYFHLLFFKFYWMRIMVCFLTSSYYAYWRTIILDDCRTLFVHKTSIVSYLLIYCTYINSTVRYGITFMSLALAPKFTWMEVTHACLLVETFAVLRNSRFFFTKMLLTILLADTLK